MALIPSWLSGPEGRFGLPTVYQVIKRIFGFRSLDRIACRFEHGAGGVEKTVTDGGFSELKPAAFVVWRTTPFTGAGRPSCS